MELHAPTHRLLRMVMILRLFLRSERAAKGERNNLCLEEVKVNYFG